MRYQRGSATGVLMRLRHARGSGALLGSMKMGSGMKLHMRGMMDMDDMMDELKAASGATFDQTFLALMIPHHQGAVTMSRMARNHVIQPETQTLIRSIIRDQNKEIRTMRMWQRQWEGKSAVKRMSPMHMMMGMGMTMSGRTMMMPGMMMGGMMGMDGVEHDLHFIEMMIPHHQDAIDMAELALTRAAHPELKTFAQQIITAQQKEIDDMEEWMAEWEE